MKRLLSVLLTLSLVFGSCAALGENDVAVAKMTKEQKRLTAYLEYLKERFDDGGKGKIMWVGVADINKDALPELFYVWRQSSGKCFFHFCQYDGEVVENEYDDNFIGYNPSLITITRLCKKGTSNHAWIIESKGKTSGGRNERRVNMFVSAISTEDTGIRFRETWKGSGNKYRYFVNDKETVRIVYEEALNDFHTKLVLASTSHYRNTGAVEKVANRSKWLKVRNAFNRAAIRYIDMR